MHSSNQVPCKFFAEGRCRFGTSCRFSHNQGGFGGGGGFGGTGGGFGGGGGFQQEQQHHHSASDHAKQYAAIEESMLKDMYEWEKGNIWPFSAYGPAGNRGSIPGFEDLSMEELRYETLSSGQVPAHIAQRLSQLQKLRSMICQDRRLARQLIDQAFKPSHSDHHAQAQPQQQLGSSLYSLLAKPVATSTPTIFGGGSSLGQPAPTGGIFGQTPGNVNPFQQQPQTASQGGSIFGSGGSSFLNTTGQSQPAATTTGFGQSGAPSIFGGSASGQVPSFGGPSSFGSTPSFAPAAQPQQPQQQTPSIFGGGIFSQQNTASTPSAFGSPAPIAQVAPLQQTQQQQGQQPSFFGGGASAFGGTPFGTSLNNATLQQPFGTDSSASAFAFKPQLTAVAPGQQMGSFDGSATSVRDQYVYSQMSDLTPEEIAAYEADSFGSCESIPLKAPPKELCR